MNKKLQLISLILLLAVGSAAYLPTLSNEFVWDDNQIIVRDRFIKQPDNWPSFFRPSIWQRHYPGDYRPVRSFAFAFNYLFWRSNPAGYHLSNLLLHLLNTLLIYTLLRLLIPKPPIALIGAALFCLYPLQSEAVAWAKNCSELIASGFLLLSLILFIRRLASPPITKRPKATLLFSLLCFLLAILSKASAAALPLLLIALASCLPERKRLKDRLISTLPYWSIAVLYLSFKALFLPRAATALITPPPLDLASRLIAVQQTLVFYLKLLIFPLNNSSERFFRLPGPWGEPSTFISALFLITYLLLIIRLYRTRGVISFFLAWPLILLLPASNFIFLTSRPLAEQRLYLPAAGVCSVAAFLLFSIYHGLSEEKRRTYFTFLGLLLFFSFLSTAARNLEWNNEIRLYESIKKISPTPRIRLNLANAYLRADRPRKAFDECLAVMKGNPALAEVYATLSDVCQKMGDHKRALIEMEKAHRLNPQHPGFLNHLALLYLQEGRLKDAIEVLEEAVRLDPQDLNAVNNLANCYLKAGEVEKADSLWKELYRLDPHHPSTYKKILEMQKGTGE